MSHIYVGHSGLSLHPFSQDLPRSKKPWDPSGKPLRAPLLGWGVWGFSV